MKSMTRPALRQIMRMQGIADMSAVPTAEIDAYLTLLKGDDGGAAFLEIMRNFETTAEKEALYRSTLTDVGYPRQVVWGASDPALKVATFGEAARRITGAEAIHELPAKHFLQEDQAEPLADLIASFVSAPPES